MQVTETLSDGLRRGFSVVIPAADLAGRHSARLAELGRTLRLPGFRPGKVPPTLVRQRFGASVGSEVLQERLNEAAQQVITERGLRPAMQPKLDLQGEAPKLATGGAAEDVAFTLEFEVLPEITPPDFAAITLPKLKAEVSDEAVDKALAEIARRQRQLVAPAEPRPSRVGDVLTIDFTGTVDGAPLPNGSGTGVTAEVGGAGFIPGFTEQLEGLSVGESRTIEATFPEDYGAREVAGKTASFAITVTDLREAQVPPVDEALAEKLGFDDLAELRDTVRRQIQRDYDRATRQRLKRALLDALAERVDFTVPESLVEAEFNQIWQRIEADRAAGQLDAEDAGKDEATLKADYRAIAVRRVRLGLLLAEIGRAHTLSVSNEELSRAMRQEASRYPGQEAQLMEFFRKNPNAIESLRGPIYEDKVVDFVLELVKLEEQTVSPETLLADPETPEKV